MSTPRLIRSLHTMSPEKTAPDVLQELRAQKNGFTQTPPIPYVPETKVWSHEFLYGTLVCVRFFSLLCGLPKKRSRRKGVLGPHTRNLPNLMRVTLRSRNSSETMVESSTECSTTLRVQRFSRRESFAPREASRGLC